MSEISTSFMSSRPRRLGACCALNDDDDNRGSQVARFGDLVFSHSFDALIFSPVRFRAAFLPCARPISLSADGVFKKS